MNYVQIRIFTLAAVAAVSVFAADDSKAGKAGASEKPKATQAKSTASQKEPALPPGVPKGAKPTWQPYTWRWVDKSGKAWIYRPTPFGVVRDEEREADRVAAKADTSPMPGELSVVDKGDTYEFSRTTPFGSTHWTVKKSEMTESDKFNLEQAKSKTAAAASQQQGK